MNSIDENESLIAGLAKGDREILEQIYRQHYPGISTFVKRNGGNEEDAWDIFQEVMVALYQRAQDPDFSINCAFFTFMYAIARNLWHKKLRKKGLQKVTINDTSVFTEGDEFKTPDSELEKRERFQLYQAKFNLLSPECQKLLNEFLRGVSMKRIAEAMGYSVNYVKKKKFNCKEKLIEMIKSDPMYAEIMEDV